MPINNLSTLTSPLSEQQLQALQPLLTRLSPMQLSWLSGYLAASSQQLSAGDFSSQVVKQASLTILYGSQTGNAKGVASELADKAVSLGIEVQCLAMDNFKPKQLKNEHYLLIVTSTQGEGEPPENAIDLHQYLFSKKAPKLEQLTYAVLALGDSSYEQFCQTGIDFDQQLSQLGGKAIIERLDADVDYEEQAALWGDKTLALFQALVGAESGQNSAVAAASTRAQAVSQYNKKNPFTAQLSVNQKITGRDSQKDIRHIEIDLADSGFNYQPGDTLGLWFENEPQMVAQLLTKVGLSGDESIEVNGAALTLSEALNQHFELTQSYPSFVQYYAQLSQHPKYLELCNDQQQLRDYCYGRQIIDFINEAPVKLSAEQLTQALRPITPRLYSISSSMSEVDEEVHLTVGVVSYSGGNESGDDDMRIGGASGFLQRLTEGDELNIYLEENTHFRLPEDESAPVIMVGPGTGIAPFRSFMQERSSTEASGKNWLIFGAQTFTDDFLYQTEWQAHLKSGLLTRLDLAFSRDQAEKIYVQDRLLQNGKTVYEWLEQGAYFYVCGDATRMAKDVHNSLLSVVSEHGGLSLDEAQGYLENLRKTKRYQKDVY